MKDNELACEERELCNSHLFFLNGFTRLHKKWKWKNNGPEFLQGQFNEFMDCIVRETKEKDWGLWEETPGALSQSCYCQRRISIRGDFLLWRKPILPVYFWTHVDTGSGLQKLNVFSRWIIFLHLPLYSWMKIFLHLIHQQELQIQTGCFQPQIFYPMEEKSSA